MGDFGDILGGLGALSGDGEGGGILDVLSGIFGFAPQERPQEQVVAYERYLCGMAKNLNVNDR